MPISKVVRNAWLPLLIVAVLVVGGFTVARVKSFFGAENAAGTTSARVDDSKPFKPKDADDTPMPYVERAAALVNSIFTA